MLPRRRRPGPILPLVLAASAVAGGSAADEGVLLVGGSASATTTRFYNAATNTWTARAAHPVGATNLACARVTLGGVTGVLAAGGLNGLTTTHFYDPALNTWTLAAPMSNGRYGLAGASLTIGTAAGMLTAGGVNDPPAVEWFDPSAGPAGAWVARVPLGSPRYGPSGAAVTIGGVAGVLVTGGWSATAATYTNSTEFFDPTLPTGSWTAKAPMNVSRIYACAAPVTRGGIAGVLVAGGYNSATTHASAEFYNPQTNAWSYVASMPSPRDQQAAAPVTIGGAAGVLAMGGSAGQTSVYFYNPGAGPLGTWTSMAPLSPGTGLAAAAVVVVGTATPTGSPTAVPSSTSTATRTGSPSPTAAPSATQTAPPPSPSHSASATDAATVTVAPPATATAPLSGSPTGSASPTASPSASGPGTPTGTGAGAPTETASPAPAAPATATPRIAAAPPHPNPVRRGQTIRFQGLPHGTSVSVYALDGSRVALLRPDATGAAPWTVPSEAATGPYAYRIAGPGGVRASGILAVLR